jgi:catechol 2,3-dioxygenase-like lactoylglutathione lyase family enzyme
VTLDNQVTLDYDHADPACRQAGQVYTSKSGNRGTYFRDPDGHLMEILTAIGGEPS